jgi:hypothetical protein
MINSHWNGSNGWQHEVGSAEYVTDDGRGKVIRRSIGFRMQYDAYVDGKLIGTRNQRGQAMTLVEKSK